MIVDNIARLCKDHGVSFARLERETGMGNGVIARWDTSSPTVANIKAVADYFGVTVDELIRETEEN